MRIFAKSVLLLVFLVFAFAGCSTTRRSAGQDSMLQGDAASVDGEAGSQQSENIAETGLYEAAPGGIVEAPDEQALQTKGPQKTLDEALEFCQASQDFWGQGDFDNAIASLDQAYNLLLQVETSEDAKLIQQKDDIRYMISRRMLEIYASQHTVVNGYHDAIPMTMNGYVDKEIKLFTTKERQFFLAAYQRSGKYRPYIVASLEQAGLPKELSWLPLIESGFKVRALSPARALGLWQFIPSTGYKFGLQRDQWIDERMDVAKSTQSAIAYLSELHKIFGDWCTVLAAYNCGEARVLRIIRDQNVNYLDNFWDLFERLPWETARYVPRFLAALQIINNPGEYGMELPDLDPPMTWEGLTVCKQMRLQDIATALEVSDVALEELNAELRYKMTPPRSYELKVAEGHGELLAARVDSIPVCAQPQVATARRGPGAYQGATAYHRVRRGETLSQLAGRYRTSVKGIKLANNMRGGDFIREGQRLKIPTGRGGPYVPSVADADPSKTLRHRVQRGDSLWLLADRYNTNIQEIMRLNGTTARTPLHVGQELIMREGTEEVKPQENTKQYHVRRGDSPYEIATRHSMTLERFLRLNNLTPRSKIFPGQTLLVVAEN